MSYGVYRRYPRHYPKWQLNPVFIGAPIPPPTPTGVPPILPPMNIDTFIAAMELDIPQHIMLIERLRVMNIDTFLEATELDASLQVMRVH